MYINYRYPSLKLKNPQLATRLGDANARRRQYLKSLRSHNERQSTAAAEGDSHETDTVFKEQPEPIVPKSIVPKSRRAKSISTALTNPALSTQREGTASRADAVAPAPMLEMYKRAPATSAVSLTRSYTSTSDEELQFPPMPAEAHASLPILCPYCLASLQLKGESSESQWK